MNYQIVWQRKTQHTYICNAVYTIKPQVLQSSIFGMIPAVSICFTTASRPSFGKMTLQCLSSLMLPWYFMYCPLLSISLRESAHLHNETLTLTTCIQTVQSHSQAPAHLSVTCSSAKRGKLDRGLGTRLSKQYSFLS